VTSLPISAKVCGNTPESNKRNLKLPKAEFEQQFDQLAAKKKKKIAEKKNGQTPVVDRNFFAMRLLPTHTQVMDLYIF
jgi:hypothetical protein